MADDEEGGHIGSTPNTAKHRLGHGRIKKTSARHVFLQLVRSSTPFRARVAMSFSPVRVTTTPAIKNAPLVGLAEGNGYFSNVHLAALVVGVPYVLKRVIPIVNRGGLKTYIFLVVILGLPITVAYWTVASMYGKRKNQKVILPSKEIEEYITINDPELKALYHGKEKIPMQVFHDAYFEGKIDFNGVSHHRRS